MKRHFSAFLAVAIVVGCFGGQHPVRADEKAEFRELSSLEEAIKVGALDAKVSAVLEKRGSVRAIVVLAVEDFPKVATKGVSPDYARRVAVQAYKKRIAEVREKLWSSKALSVKRALVLDALPIELVEFRSARDILAVLNSRLAAGVSFDNENQLSSRASFTLVGAPTANGWGEFGTGVGVAVIDGPVDHTLPFFGSCMQPDQNCRVTHRETFATSTSPRLVNHGTSVASVALTVAPRAHVISLPAVNPGGTILDSAALNALNWVVNNHAQHRIRAVNMSFGLTESYYQQVCFVPWLISRNPYLSAFAALRRLEILPIGTAGNYAMVGGSFRAGVEWPACTPGAVVVGAVYDSDEGSVQHPNCVDGSTAADMPTCFSQSGNLTTIWAPGNGIVTFQFVGSGTSLAAPHVAGAVAVLASEDPRLTGDQIVARLTTHGTPITDARTGLTRPRLNVAASLYNGRRAPANDDFQQATVLSGRSASVSQTIWSASRQAGEPTHVGGEGSSVWFAWSAPYSGPTTMETTGSNFNSTLAVYKGSALGSLANIASNDDQAAGQLTSKVAFSAIAGETYKIAVDRKANPNVVQRGHATLTINNTVSNDALANAVPLIMSAPVDGSNRAATKEAGEFEHCSNQGGASVWYLWEAPAAGAYTARILNANFGACVHVYRQTVPGSQSFANLVHASGGYWASSDNIWEAPFQAVAGGRYFIAVDGISHEQTVTSPPQTGAFRLSIGP
jgi:subtilisin family serine protease